MAKQVRMEEFLAEAVAIDGRKEWSCRFCSEGRSVEGARQTFCQCCKENTNRLFQPRLVRVVRIRPHQASVKTKMLADKACWAKETELWELREENRRLKGEARKLSVQFEDAGEEGRFAEVAKWKWMNKSIARKIGSTKERAAQTIAKHK